ncbi:SDR family NAD(P)-dependent oxidoreductase [Streptomyces sp. NPDC001617]
MSNKIALVTGASSGIGESTARHLHDAGFVVYGAARRVDRMASLAAAGVRTVALDVTDESSAEKAVADILAAHDRIDVLVNNAGHNGATGKVENACSGSTWFWPLHRPGARNTEVWPLRCNTGQGRGSTPRRVAVRASFKESFSSKWKRARSGSAW